MSTKKLANFLGLGAALCLTVALCGLVPSDSAMVRLFSFPFAQLGGLLRWLSMASLGGNLVASLFFGAIGLAPLLALMWRIVKKKAGIEDSLLVVLSALLFFMMYVMINPALIYQYIQFMDLSMGKAVLGGVFYSILIGYLILRLLRRVSRSEASEMLSWLQLFLVFAAATMVFGVFYLSVAELGDTIQAVKSANTDPYLSLTTTYVLIVLRFVLRQIPSLLSVWLLLLAIELAGTLKKEKYGRETVGAAGRLGVFCKLTVAVTVLSTVATNLMQLMFSMSLLHSSFAVDIPLSSVVLMLVLLVLAQYLDDSSKLNADNQLII